MGEIAISLREAAIRLARGSKPSDPRTLLSLLKADQIKAGFQFPAGEVPLRVNIPMEFWSTVDSARFTTALKVVSDKPSSGAYKVRLADFAKEIGDLMSQKQSDSPKQWVAAFGATRHQYEVDILDGEWRRFSEEHPEYFALAPQAPGSTRGNKQKKGWRDLAVIIAVHMVKLYQEPSKHRAKIDQVKNDIYEIAKTAKINDLPKPDAIGRVVSEIVNKIEAISSK